ncbi:acetate kinase [Rhodobacteraceae bacterium HSP-20]|uniref:Acetate kinase n=1 Tax=Paragemmobacter amnigenus TaxID=2852097 RepID=A0ABS6J0A3_9RHOB|nr:acetate kinase [Rhodobacter amnigenus]MBU9697023.1 acetate kinase [Rhodobacter amnigenus]MBV4388250.1 acetate kinase [Rhodobacter amnigenus]
MSVLVVNAGSSSLKVAVFDDALREVLAGRVTEIGGAEARVEIGPLQGARVVASHAAAMALCFEGMEEAGVPVASLRAAAHRVVHGGAALVAPCRVTEAVMAEVEACVPLAPLHNPANLTGMRAVAALVPELPQFASFDTAFHAGMPEVAARYALPAEAEALGLRRYGFHGISYASLVRKVQETGGGGLPRRVLAFHLGNGASACAILDGRSVATTMGYSPLDGLTMGTRAGGIDGNAVLRLAEVFGVAGAGRILNRESGLLGLGGASDMRALRRAGTEAARFAVAHFCYWAVRHGGSLAAAMGGVDAVCFTGGIGENDAGVRAEILHGLGFLGVEFDEAANGAGALALHPAGARVAVRIVAAEEERQIAMEAMQVMAGEA